MKGFIIFWLLLLVTFLSAQHLDFNDAAKESFFISDNASNDLDINSTWTIETWARIHNRDGSLSFPVIMDRRKVFSLYVQGCTNCGGEYSIAFVRRASNDDNIATVHSNKAGAESLMFGDRVHIAVSRDGDGTTRLYINGMLEDDDIDVDFNLPSSSNALNIGARYWGSYQRHLDGEIDEIRISDIARYTSNFTPVDEHTTDGNTRLLLHLNEGSGTNITDASGNFSGISLNDGDQVPDWVNGSIPIELMSFAATKNKETVLLNWTTLSETNNKGFEIQRSSDAINWEVLGFLEGQGDSRGEVNYNFSDKNPMSNNYYRLNQVDFDGKNTYSDVLSVTMLKDNKVSVYPNPTNDFLNVTGLNSDTDYYIFDKLGKIVSNGQTNGKIDVSVLASGVYYIKTGEDAKVIKFVME